MTSESQSTTQTGLVTSPVLRGPLSLATSVVAENMTLGPERRSGAWEVGSSRKLGKEAPGSLGPTPCLNRGP